MQVRVSTRLASHSAGGGQRVDGDVIDDRGEPIGGFPWNAGAWFGSQLGCTLWILLGAISTVSASPRSEVGWLGSFALPNVLDLSLEACRKRIGMHAALRVFLLGLTPLMLASLLVADWSGQLPRRDVYKLLLLIPAISLMLYAEERARRSTSMTTPRK